MRKSTGVGGSRSLTMSVGGHTPRGVHDKPPHRGGPSPTAAVSLCAWLAWLARPRIMAHQAHLLSRQSCQGPQTCSLHTLFRFRRGPRSVTPYKPPPRPPFACFDGLQVLAHSVLLWLRLHQVSTSSYLPFAIPTIVRASPLTVLSGIILSFPLGDLPVPGHAAAAALSIPPVLSCPKPAIPSLVIAESVCYMRKRGQQA